MKMVKAVTFILTVLLVGAGIAYAVYLSNVVNISNNTITTTEAAIKVCDRKSFPGYWSTGLAVPIAVNDMVPGQEVDLYEGHEIYIANDGGGLNFAFPGTTCTSYAPTVERAATKVRLKLRPTVTYDPESCSEGLANDLQLRFDMSGVSGSYASLKEWSAQQDLVGDILSPNTFSYTRVYARLSEESTQQKSSCKFAVNFGGIQVP